MRGNKNLVGKSTGGIFLGRGVSKFLAGRGGIPPISTGGEQPANMCEVSQPTFRRQINVVSTLWINVETTLWINDVENETKSDFGFSTLHNVDTTSVPDVETTSKQRCATLYQRCCNVASTSAKLKL